MKIHITVFSCLHGTTPWSYWGQSITTGEKPVCVFGDFECVYTDSTDQAPSDMQIQHIHEIMSGRVRPFNVSHNVWNTDGAI